MGTQLTFHLNSSGVLSSSLIINNDISASAGIIYSKLSLTNNIVNADINASAAIAATKIAGTAVTEADTGTVTNTMLAGSIDNAKLTNSSVTVGTTAISLGSSSTSLAGITTINSTTIPTSKTLVVTTDKLSVHAATTSAELAGIISDETGSGALVFGTSPTLKGPFYIQSGGGAGGSANYITTDNSTGKLSIVSGYPLDLTATGDVTITATGGSAKVGSDTIATLTATQTNTTNLPAGNYNYALNLTDSASNVYQILQGGFSVTTSVVQ